MMNPHEKTEPGQTSSLAYEIDLKHSPQKIWRALTDPELLAQWLLPVVGLDLAPNAKFTFQSQPQPGWDGVVHCTMLEATPLERMRFQWVVGDIDTTVTFTLAPLPSGTRLSILQTGFKPTQKQNFGGARYGWNMMTEKLLALLEKVQ